MAGASLEETILYNTDLRAANLSGADLSKANLTGVQLCKNGIEGAFFDDHTLWPAGFDPIAAGAVKGEPPPTLVRLA